MDKIAYSYCVGMYFMYEYVSLLEVQVSILYTQYMFSTSAFLGRSFKARVLNPRAVFCIHSTLPRPKCFCSKGGVFLRPWTIAGKD